MRILLLPASHPAPVDEAVDIVGKKHDEAGHHGEIGEVVGRSDDPEYDEHYIIGTIADAVVGATQISEVRGTEAGGDEGDEQREHHHLQPFAGSRMGDLHLGTALERMA